MPQANASRRTIRQDRQLLRRSAGRLRGLLWSLVAAEEIFLLRSPRHLVRRAWVEPANVRVETARPTQIPRPVCFPLIAMPTVHPDSLPSCPRPGQPGAN